MRFAGARSKVITYHSEKKKQCCWGLLLCVRKMWCGVVCLLPVWPAVCRALALAMLSPRHVEVKKKWMLLLCTLKQIFWRNRLSLHRDSFWFGGVAGGGESLLGPNCQQLTESVRRNFAFASACPPPAAYGHKTPFIISTKLRGRGLLSASGRFFAHTRVATTRVAVKCCNCRTCVQGLARPDLDSTAVFS